MQASRAWLSGHPEMTLNFPNLSRSYDAAGNRIRFWGHDGAIEVPFFLEIGGLLRLYPGTPYTKSRILAAFDAARDRVTEAATRVYSPRRRRSFYVLAAGDFS
jgi:hypothetical protein